MQRRVTLIKFKAKDGQNYTVDLENYGASLQFKRLKNWHHHLRGDEKDKRPYNIYEVDFGYDENGHGIGFVKVTSKVFKRLIRTKSMFGQVLYDTVDIDEKGAVEFMERYIVWSTRKAMHEQDSKFYFKNKNKLPEWARRLY